MAVVVALAANSFAWRRFESNFAFSKLDHDLQREMIFTTESAFYYSYYRDVLEAEQVEQEALKLHHTPIPTCGLGLDLIISLRCSRSRSRSCSRTRNCSTEAHGAAGFEGRVR